MPIRLKLLFIVLLPVLAAVLIGGLLYDSHSNRIADDEYSILLRKIEMASVKLMYAVQTERGGTLLYLTSGQESLRSKVDTLRSETDYQMTAFLSLLNDVGSDLRFEWVNNRVDYVRHAIPILRQQVDNAGHNRADYFQSYTTLVNRLSSMLYLHPGKTDHSRNYDVMIEAAQKLVELQLLRGERRAIVAQLLAGKSPDYMLLDQLVQLVHAERSMLRRNETANALLELMPWIDHYHQVTMRIDDISEMLLEWNEVSWGEREGEDFHELKQTIGIRPDIWFDLASSQMEYVQEVVTQYLDEDRYRLEQIMTSSIEEHNRIIGISILLIILTLIIAYFVSRQMIRSMQEIRNGMSRFVEFLTYQKKSVPPVVLRHDDEFMEIADNMNESFELVVEQSNKDLEFIDEASHVIEMMRLGHFDERLHDDAKHPGLMKLKRVINAMLDVIEEKINAATHDLQIHNAKLEKEVQARLDELMQVEKGIAQSMIVMELDEHNRIAKVNSAFEKRLGYKLEEAVGTTIERYMVPDDRNYDLIRSMHSRLEHHGICKEQITLLDHMGEAVSIDVTFILLKNMEGEVTKQLGLCIDITDIVEGRKKAEEAERAKGDFLANMSHEIRTPLNAIMGFVNILKKSITDPKQSRHIDIIYQSSTSLLGIINDILDFSKINSGAYKIDQVPFSPMDELSHVIQLHASKAVEKQQLFLPFVDLAMPGRLRGDGLRIKQVINNLLSNAIKFTPEQGEIKLFVTYTENGMLVIKVQDTGIGMTPEQQSRVFTPFEQADSSTTREFGGTGLGLAISKLLVELMGGNIQLQSDLGAGTTFTVSVPMPVEQQESTLAINAEKAAHTTVAFLALDKANHDLYRLIRHYMTQMGFTSLENVEKLPEYGQFDLIIAPYQSLNFDTLEAKQQFAVAVYADGQEQPESSYAHIFALTLPFTPKSLLQILDDATVASLQSSVKEEEDTAPVFSGKVLIVEDNRTNQMLIKLMMDDYGIEYVIAENGEEAINCFKAEPFDLILMDINMPVMGGMESTKAIRHYEKESGLVGKTPIVALTANVMSDDKQLYEKSGMDGHLAKPIDTDELEKILKKYLILRMD